MRQFVIAFFVLALLLGGAVYATDCYKDTSIHKTGDWFATLGKKGMEKNGFWQSASTTVLRFADKKNGPKITANL